MDLMVSSRLRSVGFVVVLALASMLTVVLAWTTSAQSASKPRPTPEDRIANSFIVTGGDGFTVFEEASATQQTLGRDLDALEAHIQNLPDPFSAPNPATEQRITKQG